MGKAEEVQHCTRLPQRTFQRKMMPLIGHQHHRRVSPAGPRRCLLETLARLTLGIA